jgi:hypothetical protein
MSCSHLCLACVLVRNEASHLDRRSPFRIGAAFCRLLILSYCFASFGGEAAAQLLGSRGQSVKIGQWVLRTPEPPPNTADLKRHLLFSKLLAVTLTYAVNQSHLSCPAILDVDAYPNISLGINLPHVADRRPGCILAIDKILEAGPQAVRSQIHQAKSLVMAWVSSMAADRILLGAAEPAALASHLTRLYYPSAEVYTTLLSIDAPFATPVLDNLSDFDEWWVSNRQSRDIAFEQTPIVDRFFRETSGAKPEVKIAFLDRHSKRGNHVIFGLEFSSIPNTDVLMNIRESLCKKRNVDSLLTRTEVYCSAVNFFSSRAWLFAEYKIDSADSVEVDRALKSMVEYIWNLDRAINNHSMSRSSIAVFHFIYH